MQERGDHPAPRRRAGLVVAFERHRDHVALPALEATLGLALPGHDRRGADIEAAFGHEAGDARLIEEDDRPARVERQNADAANERAHASGIVRGVHGGRSLRHAITHITRAW